MFCPHLDFELELDIKDQCGYVPCEIQFFWSSFILKQLNSFTIQEEREIISSSTDIVR